MGLFNRKAKELAVDDAAAAELALLRAVLGNYPPGHRIRPGERCVCPHCGELSFVTAGTPTSARTHHRCASCDRSWVITEEAMDRVLAEDAARTEALLADAAAASGGRALQVLLVEDDPADAAMVQAILAPAMPSAVQLVTVDNRGDAESTARLGFDVVLLDLNLPDSRGMATAEHFAATCPDAHVCVCTGDNELADRAQSLGRPILRKHQLVDLVERRHQGTAELLAVLRASAA